MRRDTESKDSTRQYTNGCDQKGLEQSRFAPLHTRTINRRRRSQFRVATKVVLKEGYLVKIEKSSTEVRVGERISQSGNKWWYVLSPGQIAYFKSHEDMSSSDAILGLVSLRDASLIVSPVDIPKERTDTLISERRRPPPFQKMNSCIFDGCDVLFGVLKERKFCRRCGRSLCEKHCSRRIGIPEFGFNEPVRVCSSCFPQFVQSDLTESQKAVSKSLYLKPLQFALVFEQNVLILEALSETEKTSWVSALHSALFTDNESKRVNRGKTIHELPKDSFHQFAQMNPPPPRGPQRSRLISIAEGEVRDFVSRRASRGISIGDIKFTSPAISVLLLQQEMETVRGRSNGIWSGLNVVGDIAEDNPVKLQSPKSQDSLHRGSFWNTKSASGNAVIRHSVAFRDENGETYPQVIGISTLAQKHLKERNSSHENTQKCHRQSIGAKKMKDLIRTFDSFGTDSNPLERKWRPSIGKRDFQSLKTEFDQKPHPLPEERFGTEPTVCSKKVDNTAVFIPTRLCNLRDDGVIPRLNEDDLQLEEWMALNAAVKKQWASYQKDVRIQAYLDWMHDHTTHYSDQAIESMEKDMKSFVSSLPAIRQDDLDKYLFYQRFAAYFDLIEDSELQHNVVNASEVICGMVKEMQLRQEMDEFQTLRPYEELIQVKRDIKRREQKWKNGTEKVRVSNARMKKVNATIRKSVAERVRQRVQERSERRLDALEEEAYCTLLLTMGCSPQLIEEEIERLASGSPDELLVSVNELEEEVRRLYIEKWRSRMAGDSQSESEEETELI